MVDDHLIFLVTIPIHYGGNDSSEKDVFGSEKSSEKIIKSSETTAISSGTHPHKFLDTPSGKDEHGDIHTSSKNIQKFDLSVIFARKLQKSHFKMG